MNKKKRKKDIMSLSMRELTNWLKEHNEKKFRGSQILKWIYQNKVNNFEEMKNLNKELIIKLKKYFSIRRLKIEAIYTSKDGSKKYIFTLYDNNSIETILIPEKKHFTICISSQIGCSQKCIFCKSSKIGFIRNLNSNEIISQIRDIKDTEIYEKYKNKKINLVFMGMGEPLANYSELIKSINLISNSEYGLKISSKNITISTSGLIPEINKLGFDTSVNLAISLNASNDKTRTSLMPINKIYPIKKLINSCENYPVRRRQKITFEYVLIKNINDNLSDAIKLSKLLIKSKAKINLIPFNKYKKNKYQRPSKNEILSFQKILTENNYTTLIRYSKGSDIFGACGQLKTQIDNFNKKNNNIIL